MVVTKYSKQCFLQSTAESWVDRFWLFLVKKCKFCKTARYERLCEDLRDKGYNTMNLPFEVGCRGVINARNHLVLEDICNLVRIRARKKLIGSLGRIALLGSYRIWLARYSQEWSGGELIRWSNNWRRTTTSFSISSNHIFSYCDQYPMYLYLQPVAWASKSPLETFQLPGLQVVWLCRVVMCPWQWIQSNLFSWIIYEFKKYILSHSPTLHPELGDPCSAILSSPASFQFQINSNSIFNK